MRHIIQVSGGKDSTATILWAIDKGLEFTCIFCDTGNESQITYDYLDYLESTLNLDLIRIKPKLDFWELAKKKKRFPSTKARFCTTELKVIPFTNWLLEQSGSFRIYMGMRAQESGNRANMNTMDDYFKLRKGDYAVRKIRAWLKAGNEAIAVLPIHSMTHSEVFALHKKHSIKPNPLYLQGLNRVGCFPCIMCRKGELSIIAKEFPEVIEKIAQKEKELGSTFFPPSYIATNHIATIDEVVQYVQRNDLPDQTEMFELPTCKSTYNLCE
jgi:3'-phosphoadenosine 5'-phosphosulfate sulfotransferase (PAPS reductase)/FAD synthetase